MKVWLKTQIEGGKKVAFGEEKLANDAPNLGLATGSSP